MKTSGLIVHSCFTGLIFLVAIVNVTPVSAEVTAEQLLAQINERKARMDQFRALLNAPDQHTRLASLDVMLKSDDPALKEIAYGIGFASADDAMRALALKGKFRDLKALPLRFELPQNPNEKETDLFHRWSGTYSFQLREFDDVSGQFSVRTEEANTAMSGHVSGTGMEFESRQCRGQFSLGDGAILAGELACKYIGVFPASIRLH